MNRTEQDPAYERPRLLTDSVGRVLFFRPAVHVAAS